MDKDGDKHVSYEEFDVDGYAHGSVRHSPQKAVRNQSATHQHGARGIAPAIKAEHARPMWAGLLATSLVISELRGTNDDAGSERRRARGSPRRHQTT